MKRGLSSKFRRGEKSSKFGVLFLRGFFGGSQIERIRENRLDLVRSVERLGFA